MQWVPENKTFLYIVLALILFLAGYKLYQSRPIAREKAALPAVGDVTNLLSREMGIRQRHDELRRIVREWDACFLRGGPREAGLSLRKAVEAWAKDANLNYESTQMQGETGENIGLIIQGSADYGTVRRFLQRVESAPIAVSVVAIRIKADEGEKIVRYELKLEAPLLTTKGGAKNG